MYATMKTALALCAAACSVCTVAAGVADRRFLSGGGVKLRDVAFHKAESMPLANVVDLRARAVATGLPLAEVLAKAKQEEMLKAAAAQAEAAKLEAATADQLEQKMIQLREQLKAARSRGDEAQITVLKGEIDKLEQLIGSKVEAEAAAALPPQPAPAPAGPAPAPGPAPMPMPVTPPPIPPCNWTYDFEGVARPANCLNITVGFGDLANYTCVRGGNMTFNDEDTECYAPPVARCANPTKSIDGFPHDPNWGDKGTPLYAILGMDDDTIKHGAEFEIVCADKATALDHRYPLEAWGQDWYPGIQKVSAVCNNGTILRMEPTNMTFFPGHPFYKPAGIKPKDLRCVLKEKVDLTQDIVSYLRWTEPRMHEAETRGYKWIDMDAKLHKKLLKDAMNESSHIEMDARDMGELKEIPDLKRVIKALIDNRMIPRGEEFTDATCKDLEKHWLYELKNSDPFKKAGNIGYANYVEPIKPEIGYPTAEDMALNLKRPVDFSCSYTLQKTAAGADPYTRTMNWRYRDGCFCESRWTGGCPFRAELRPNFQTFGFDAVEIKMLSTSPGVATNALCWYFSKPANPEWGYLRTDTGFAYQAPAQNVTELKRDWIALRKKAQAARWKTGRV